MKKVFFVLTVFLLVSACSSTSIVKNDRVATNTDISETEDHSPVYGWVKLSFDITEAGETDNIQVLASSPSGYFDEDAIKAVSEWKYNPFIIDGVPTRQVDNMVHLDYVDKKDGN
ncbi:energy transducer TonB [Alteromonas sp. ALT199]|uniref:energy transducer TonB n=1 Tax=unclassified Alteromonas TaxID=2614992 RepID=UPI001BE8B253|nr:energy transducer TonB [Alteromonas sp. ALT199]MBT3134156.1 energy transducer TonB [Alteromonas sp. ALT199]